MLRCVGTTGESALSLRTFANIRFPCSPAKAGVQEREALYFGSPGKEPLRRSGLGPGLRRGTAMKPMNVFPMIILLIAVVLIVIWLRPH
jgi:hypothetical protein